MTKTAERTVVRAILAMKQEKNCCHRLKGSGLDFGQQRLAVIQTVGEGR